jgi:GDP-L-fucose synthase
MHFELTGKRIFVAGHRGMLGSAIVRRLATEQCEVIVATRQELNLLDQAATRSWMQLHKPDAVVLAAAKVGGILANSEFPAEFLYENLNIATNVIHAAHEADVSRLLNLGSSCIYPKFADQPIKEESLLAGSLEPTNEWYAIAKIAGLKLAEAYRIQYDRDYISAMPTNLYGPGDNYDLQSSHVLPALIRKVHEAMQAKSKSITIWGSGNPKREFLHADDCADACVFLLKNYSANLHVNVGSGTDISIADLAQLIGDILGYQGSFQHDLSKPDGTPRKLMSNGRLASMGWKPSITLRDGIALAYRDFIRGEVRR